MRRVVVAVAILQATVLAAADLPTTDPLPSWQDGEVKTAIVAFVAAVTDTSSPDFVPQPERVAVFDNDGTSWCERPGYVPTRFQVDLLRGFVAEGRVDGSEMPFRAWLDDDRGALRKFGWSDAYIAMNAQFAGMPVQAYRDAVVAYLTTTTHEKYGRPHTELYYTPMRELRRYLDDHGFQVWVVTGGAQDFVRSYIEAAFGIPPERVIGSWTRPVYDTQDGDVTMVRGESQVSNGYENKPANIELRIGRRPIVAVGNSNNDEPMCRWSVSGPRRSLALWIHHDDGAREYAYDRGTSRIERLTTDHPHAYEVSMKRHWRRVFDHESE